MSEFDVKVGGSQAGLITFSDTAVTNLRIGQISQRERFNKYLNEISHISTAFFYFFLEHICICFSWYRDV